MTSLKILIAGATGTNGQELVKALRKKGVVPRAVVRNIDKARDLLGEGIELVEGDLADVSSLRAAMVGVDKAYIVTGVMPNTVELFANFFKAAKLENVRHVVKFSGLGSSVESPSEVIRQHAASDNLLRESGLIYTIIRPNSFHQNLLFQATTITETGTFYFPLGSARQSIIDVRDIAEITTNILLSDEHENKSYDLTGPQSLTYHEVAAIMSDVRGESVEYVPISVAEAENAMLSAGMPKWSAHALAEIQGLFGTGAYADVLPESEYLLGRRPITFEKFMKDNVELFMN